MSRDSAEGPGRSGRNTSRRPLLISIAALIVVIVVVVVVVVVATGGDGDDSQNGALSDGQGGTATSFPYDMIELPDDTSLGKVSKASFISILVPNDAGTLTSYGVSSDLPAAEALASAVADADEVDEQLAASVTASTVVLSSGTGGSGATSTITFVLPTRETLTFALSLDEGLIARGGKAWRVKGDLRALVEAAIKSPQ